MTDAEKDRKMVLDYLDTAFTLKRSIARLRKQRQETFRLCDRAALDRRIEGLECNYYDQIFAVDRFRHLLTKEEQEQVKQANREVNAPYQERAEQQRRYNREYKKRRNWNGLLSGSRIYNLRRRRNRG